MAKPKLALIPAAYGSKFYSILPSDGVGDFDFSRSSVATRINTEGLIESLTSGQSRLDYPLVNGVQKGCPHYLLEPSRTNSYTYSEDFTKSTWNKLNVNVTPNAVISPDGTLNASKITSDATAAQGVIIYDNAIPTSSSSEFTLTCYLKAAEVKWVQVFFGTGDITGSPYVNFDIVNGTLGTVSSGLSVNTEAYLNGFYKITITATALGTTVSPYFSAAKTGTDTRSMGTNNWNAGDGFFMWGAQIEVGSFATSYIPTNGTTATRVAETANGSGNASTFNDSEGVLMAEISALADDGGFRLITLKGTSQSIKFGFRSDSNMIYLDISGVAFLTHVVNDIKAFNKVAIKYGTNGTKLIINGFEVGSDPDNSSFAGIFDLSFNLNGGSSFYGKTKQLQYFDLALADTQLEQLTSWLSFRDMAEAQSYTIQ